MKEKKLSRGALAIISVIYGQLSTSPCVRINGELVHPFTDAWVKQTKEDLRKVINMEI